MTHVIAGFGEVGQALFKLLTEGDHDDIYVKDAFYDVPNAYPDESPKPVDILHICFPFTKQESFIEQCKTHTTTLLPTIVIIHSTVPVGTTAKCGEGFVHSPIRGVHPYLYDSLKKFTKYFGGPLAKEAAKPFKQRKVSCTTYDNSKTTEALKLWCTSQYAVMIALQKLIYGWCEEHKISFDAVYTDANLTYNIGFNKLHRRDVLRPVLKQMDGPIGGHCVMPNLKLLDERILTKFVNDILRMEGEIK